MGGFKFVCFVNSTCWISEEEKEEVGVKVMEALDENFQTHEEKIHSLTNGHAKKLDIGEERSSSSLVTLVHGLC